MSQKTNTQRGPLIAAGVALAAALGVGASVLYQQKQAIYPSTVTGAQAAAAVRDEWRKPVDPAILAKASADKLALAKLLREKWRDAWATKHQDELRAMLRAQPSDQAAMQAVVDKLPGWPSKEKTGFTIEDLGPTEGLSNPEVVSGSWAGRNARPATPELAQEAEESNRLIKVRTEKEFRTNRDIILSRIASGRTSEMYCLWASGRVTTQKYEWNQRGADGKIHVGLPPHQPVLPPYDFLQKENA